MPSPARQKSPAAPKLRMAKLIERGWTKELVSLYLPPFHECNGLYPLSDVEKIEHTPEWKADRSSSAAGEHISLSKADLKSRGWSLSMMEKLLGEPDFIIRLRQRRVMHKYRVSRITEAEHGEVFQELKKSAATRSARGKAVTDKRAEAVRTAVHKMSEQLKVSPPPTLNALRKLALDAQQEWYDGGEQGYSVEGVDHATVDRWCRNYLRHNCSNYEDLLERIEYEFRGQPGVRELYDDIVRPMIDRKVNDAMQVLHG